MTSRTADHDRGGERIALAAGRVVLERDLRVGVRDGITLSLDVFRPATGGPVPAVLEAVPYRKDDVAAVRDRLLGRALAERGFALVRLDVRGTGHSEGVALDEYTETEQEDAVETVAWISEQEWCSGAVGAYGVSYGGFAAIQLAARRPPALGAIAAIYATDDRYTDDVHFYGGALCALELVHYPLRMLAMNALPPGDVEPEAWKARIEATPPWVLRWLAEQRDGPYWRAGSLRPRYERIECPMLVVGGWRDGYVNTAVRMAEHVRAPVRLVVGPWPHVRPQLAGIPPTLDLVGLLASWFGRHLRGDPAEEDEEGALVFVQSYDDPTRIPERISGEWWRVRSWPQRKPEPERFRLGTAGALAKAAGEPAELTVEHAPHAGTQTGIWCPPPPPHGLPGDQRPDEVHALLFTSEPLPEPLVCLGFPRLRLRVSHPGPMAILSAKLADVAPDGRSQLVTRAVLNLAHRDGHEEPSRPPPEWTEIELVLNATGWRFAPKHRIRLALAGSDWPTVWPAPTAEPLHVRVGADEAVLELPRAPDGEVVEVAPAPPPPPEPTVCAYPSTVTWRAVRDGIARTAGVESSIEVGQEISDTRTTTRETRTFVTTASESDPLDIVVEGVTSFHLGRPDVDVRTTATGRFTCTAEHFRAELSLEVEADGRPFARRRWNERVPRDLV